METPILDYDFKPHLKIKASDKISRRIGAIRGESPKGEVLIASMPFQSMRLSSSFVD
jgi:hypothetical protein